jgi:hypothetical protein
VDVLGNIPSTKEALLDKAEAKLLEKYKNIKWTGGSDAVAAAYLINPDVSVSLSKRNIFA